MVVAYQCKRNSAHLLNKILRVPIDIFWDQTKGVTI